MNLDGDSDSIPLWLLYENEIEAWRAAQTPQIARWISEQNFKGGVEEEKGAYEVHLVPSVAASFRDVSFCPGSNFPDISACRSSP